MNIQQKLATIPKGKVIKIVALLLVGGFAFLLSRGIKKSKKNKSIEDELLGQIAQKKLRKDSLAKAGGETQEKQNNLLKEYQGKREENNHAQRLKQDRNKRLTAVKNNMEIRFSGEGEPAKEELNKPIAQTKHRFVKNTNDGYRSSPYLQARRLPTPRPKEVTVIAKTTRQPPALTFGSTSTKFRATKRAKLPSGGGFEAVIDGTQTLVNGQRVRLLIKSGTCQGASVKPNTLAYAQLTYKQNRAVMMLYQVSTIEGIKQGAIQNIGQDGQLGLFLTSNRSSRAAKKATDHRLTNKLGNLANSATGGIAGEVAGIAGAVFRDKSRQEKIRLFNGTKIFFR